jgi:hypothetical protein
MRRIPQPWRALGNGDGRRQADPSPARMRAFSVGSSHHVIDCVIRWACGPLSWSSSSRHLPPSWLHCYASALLSRFRLCHATLPSFSFLRFPSGSAPSDPASADSPPHHATTRGWSPCRPLLPLLTSSMTDRNKSPNPQNLNMRLSPSPPLICRHTIHITHGLCHRSCLHHHPCFFPTVLPIRLWHRVRLTASVVGWSPLVPC